MAIPVKLPVFEGPLDLLLHLIDKNKIDKMCIRDSTRRAERFSRNPDQTPFRLCPLPGYDTGRTGKS